MKNLTVENWIILNALFMVIGGIGVLYSLPLISILVLGILSFTVLLYFGTSSFQQWKPYGGYANRITLFRLLVLIFTVTQVEYFSNIQLFILFSSCLLLDGVDGVVARHYKQESEWGALFDKEVDSFFVFVLSLILYQYYEIPVWIVTIGLLHYFYEIVLYFLNWQHIVTKKNPIGRYVAFLLFVGLLIPLIINHSWIAIILGVISGLTLVSFGISFFMKYKNWKVNSIS